MTNWQLFHYPSPVSFFVWHGDANIAERLLSEWGWKIYRRGPANAEALAQFVAFVPEPGLDEEVENAVLSRWRGWNILVLYFSFGSLREIYINFPVPIIEFTVPAGTKLAQLGDVPDFRLDLMVGQRFYYVFVRDGVLWRDELEPELSEKQDGRLILQNNGKWAVEWSLNADNHSGHTSQDRILFSSNLGQNLEQLGLPLKQWQNQDLGIVSEALRLRGLRT